MTFKITTSQDQQETERLSTMSVLLKQKTWETIDGIGVPDGHISARFLVGPEGATVTAAKAKALGLKNGNIEMTEEITKSMGPQNDKEHKAHEDKSTGPSLADRIEKAMREVAKEALDGGEDAWAQNMTSDGKPDSRVLSSRLGEQVSANDRDEIWAKIEDSIGDGDSGDSQDDEPI